MKKIQTALVTGLICAMAIAVALVFYAANVLTDNSSGAVTSLTGGWTVNGVPVTLPYVTEEHDVTLIRTLDRVGPDAALFLRTNYHQVTATLDGRALNVDGRHENGTFGVSYTNPWVIIKLPHAGVLSLRVSDRNALVVGTVTFGTEADLLRALIRDNAGTILLCFFLVLLGLITIVLAVPIGRRMREMNSAGFFALGTFSILAAIWILTDSNLLRIFSANTDALYFISYFSFMLLPVPLLLFIRQACLKYWLVLDAFAAAFLLWFGFVITQLVTRAHTLMDFLPATHGMLIITSLLICVICAVDRFKNKNRTLTEILFGLVALTVCSALALVRYYLVPRVDNALFFRQGVLLFTLLLIVSAVRHTLLVLGESQSFTKLAGNISCGLVRVTADPAFTIRYANDFYYEMFGYDPEAPGITTLGELLRPEDRVALINRCFSGDTRFEQELRQTTASGNEIWVLICVNHNPGENELTVAVFDITARKQVEEQLRIREEEYRIAAEQSDKLILRHDIRTRRSQYQNRASQEFGIPDVMDNVPESVLKRGMIAPESEDEYQAMYDAMYAGAPRGSANVCIKTDRGWRWYHADFTTIFDQESTPLQAVLSFYDITDRREREIAYEKWRQSYEALPRESMQYYECNLSRDTFEHEEGALLPGIPDDVPRTLAEVVRYTATYFVFADDRESFSDFYTRERLLARFDRGMRSDTMEFRRIEAGEPRWTRAAVQLLADPYSSDVRAFFLFEDIDEMVTMNLTLETRSKQDPLTGLYNRIAFAALTDEALKEPGIHALLLLDLDRFKSINDTLGHSVGDCVLTEVADAMREGCDNALLGRLGGDEFVLLFAGLPDEQAAMDHAGALLDCIRSSIELDVRVSASIGVAFAPQDGNTFATLYECADAALYHAKWGGRDRVARYTPALSVQPVPTARGTMLIADDIEMNRAVLVALFADDYEVLEARDGEETLDLLRKHAETISVLLLDILMPKLDGLDVLRAMQDDPALSLIPVIVTSDEGEEDVGLHAIEAGANDFVEKPIDPRIVKLRVASAIRKREMDSLRAQNRYLVVQKEEQERYRDILLSTNTIVLEYDFTTGQFQYDLLVAEHLAGTYDDRPLWEILREDRVASAQTITALEEFFYQTVTATGNTIGRMNVRLRTREAGEHWFRVSLSKRVDETGATRKLHITLLDVDSELALQNQLKYLAEFDPLTGIYNKNSFLQKARELIDSDWGETFAIVRFDVDRFKVINDVFGHDTGDRLICHIADSLRRFMRHRGAFGRLDADHFALCIPYSERVIEEMLATSHEDLATFELSFDVVVSFGVYIVSDRALGVDAMIDRAALAQRTVKGKYLQRVAYYDEKMRAALLDEQELTSQMVAALASGQFQVYLQPKVCLKTGTLCGAEALVRWIHPERGFLSPGAFIPLFERNGFIMRLDAFVWEEVTRFLRAELDAGHTPYPVSANVSRVNLYNPSLVKTLVGLVQKYQLPPGLFELEITESAYAASPELLAEVTGTLRDAGFVIDMDDFGSGYSSLNMLRDIPVDVLKIDMKFLFGAKDGDRGSSILKSVLSLADGLGLPTVAEGVETEEQAEFLASAGCGIAQGYLFYHPMPMEAYHALCQVTCVDLKEGETERMEDYVCAGRE